MSVGLDFPCARRCVLTLANLSLPNDEIVSWCDSCLFCHITAHFSPYRCQIYHCNFPDSAPFFVVRTALQTLTDVILFCQSTSATRCVVSQCRSLKQCSCYLYINMLLIISYYEKRLTLTCTAYYKIFTIYSLLSLTQR